MTHSGIRSVARTLMKYRAGHGEERMSQRSLAYAAGRESTCPLLGHRWRKPLCRTPRSAVLLNVQQVCWQT